MTIFNQKQALVGNQRLLITIENYAWICKRAVTLWNSFFWFSFFFNDNYQKGENKKLDDVLWIVTPQTFIIYSHV